MSKYVFTEEMAEISGFGGDYETACRAMVVAGLEWFDEHPDADPKFRHFENVYGALMEDNEDAKVLSRVVLNACPKEEATGAMHQATIGTIFWVRKDGWEKYVAMMREPKLEKENKHTDGESEGECHQLGHKWSEWEPTGIDEDARTFTERRVCERCGNDEWRDVPFQKEPGDARSSVADNG